MWLFFSFKVFFHVRHKGLSERGTKLSLFVRLRAIFSKYNPEQVGNNTAKGNIFCLFFLL